MEYYNIMSASEKNAFMHSANGECRSCAAFAHDIIFLKAVPLSVSDVCEKMFTSLGVMARLFLFHLYFFKNIITGFP